MKACIRIICLIMAVLFLGTIPMQARADILILPEEPTIEMDREPTYFDGDLDPTTYPEPEPVPVPEPEPIDVGLIVTVSMWIIALIAVTSALLILIKKK